MPRKSAWGPDVDSDSDEGKPLGLNKHQEQLLIEKPEPEPNIAKGAKLAIHLPGDKLCKDGYLFIRFFHGGQDSVPALLWSVSMMDYVVRNYPQHFDYITSLDVPKANQRALLNQDEVHISRALSHHQLCPTFLHFSGDETRTAHMTMQYCDAGTATAYYQSMPTSGEREAFMWLLLASAVRSFALFITREPQEWGAVLHSDANTSNFFVHFNSSASPPTIMIADFSRSHRQSQPPRGYTTVFTRHDDFKMFWSSIGTSPPLSGDFPPQVLSQIHRTLDKTNTRAGALDLVKDGTYLRFIERHKTADVRLRKPRIDKKVPFRTRGETRRDKLK